MRWRETGKDTSAPKLSNTLIRPDMTIVRLLSAALFYDSHIARLIRRPVWSALYTVTCDKLLPEGLMTFLNLGYLATPGKLGVEDGEDIADRVSEKLYDQVVCDVDLTGGRVAEVGCGPGAGSAHLARVHSPASVVGIDFNRRMIIWCRKHHKEPNLSFLEGDALDLPIADGSVDVVVNIESSHCYPSRLRFFQEVVRVLSPGGAFLFADVILCVGSKQGPDAVSNDLGRAGLIVDSCTDITKKVLAARDAVTGSPLFRARLRDNISFVRRPVLEEGLCLTGTTFYKLMSSGRLRYIQWKASKPGNNTAFMGPPGDRARRRPETP
jgi:SAM-dependent methyltransferase